MEVRAKGNDYKSRDFNLRQHFPDIRGTTALSSSL